MISLHVEPIPYSGLVVVQTLTNLLPALSKSTVSPTLRFFLLLFSEIQCSPVDMSVYPHYLHYMFGFLSHPLGCFFFCRILYRDDRIKGTSSTRVQRNVGLDERFDREWRNLAAWLVHGDFWKNCRAPLPPFSVTQR